MVRNPGCRQGCAHYVRNGLEKSDKKLIVGFNYRWSPYNTKIKELLASSDINRDILLKGWVRTRRGSKNVSFIAVNDGSTIHNIQVVADAEFDENLIITLSNSSANANVGTNDSFTYTISDGQGSLAIGVVSVWTPLIDREIARLPGRLPGMPRPVEIGLIHHFPEFCIAFIAGNGLVYIQGKVIGIIYRCAIGPAIPDGR